MKMCCLFRLHVDISLTLFKRLLTKGADVNAKCDNEKMPLHLACENNMIELFQYYAWYSIFF
jgi:ankyrin repeat protein